MLLITLLTFERITYPLNYDSGICYLLSPDILVTQLFTFTYLKYIDI